MNSQAPADRLLWLVVGLMAGLCVAYFWPHEPALAEMADRDEKFMMVTAQVDPDQDISGIFVLDFVTGQITGRVLNPSYAEYTHGFTRNVAADFDIDPTAKETHYVMVAGGGAIPSRGGRKWATSLIYVGELNSGKVNAYAFEYKAANRVTAKSPTQEVPLRLVRSFQFRESY